MAQEIRILLVDDHSLFRDSLSRLLQTEADFRIVGSCATIAEALTIIASEKPDIVLLDYDLGEEQGTVALDEIRKNGFKGRVLMVTAGMNRLDSSLAWRLGISGVFLKHSSPATLLEAIRTVAGGGVWIDHKTIPPAPQADRPGPKGLTPREQQVLRSVFEGLTNKEIAYRIGVSQSSVKATLQQLFEKTGVRTRSQLVRIAIERSLEAIGKPGTR